MTRSFAITCSWLFLMISGCSTNVEQPRTPPSTGHQVEQCQLVPCNLPARGIPRSNEDWTRAVEVLEGELKSCAIQVIKCIKTQNITQVPLVIEQPKKPSK